MRLVVLLQIFLYLILPAFFYDASRYAELYILNFCFLISFLCFSYITIDSNGRVLSRREHIGCGVDFKLKEKLSTGIGWGRIGFIFLAIFVVLSYYTVLVFKYGLLDRRIGSEAIGLLYSRISLLDLLYLRVVEIAYPIVFIYLFFFEKRYRIRNGFLFKFVNVFFLIIFFFFSAKWQSKSEIAFFLLVMLIFSGSISSSRMFLYQFRRFFRFFLVVLIVFFVVSFFRYKDYSGSFYDIFYRDFVERLDGDKILGQLIDIGALKIYGTFDFSVYKYYISLLPFLNEAVYLKSIAMTSAKNYFLVDVLSLDQYDATSTLVTDMAYFGGFWAVSLLGFLMGYICKKVDRIILSDKYKNSYIFSILVSLVFSFSRIEFEVIPQIFLFFKTFFLVFCITKLFKKMGLK